MKIEKTADPLIEILIQTGEKIVNQLADKLEFRLENILLGQDFTPEQEKAITEVSERLYSEFKPYYDNGEMPPGKKLQELKEYGVERFRQGGFKDTEVIGALLKENARVGDYVRLSYVSSSFGSIFKEAAGFKGSKPELAAGYILAIGEEIIGEEPTRGIVITLCENDPLNNGDIGEVVEIPKGIRTNTQVHEFTLEFDENERPRDELYVGNEVEIKYQDPESGEKSVKGTIHNVDRDTVHIFLGKPEMGFWKELFYNYSDRVVKLDRTYITDVATK